MYRCHTIVIGAGQAGLAAGYYLKQKGINFVILEAGAKVGQSWSERYDSLKLFTYSRYNNLPGIEFPGDKNRFPTKDEVAHYLAMYADYFDLPVYYNCRVTMLEKDGDKFVLTTERDYYKAINVIIATGPFQKPFVPSFSERINSAIFQIHSSQYRNPQQLMIGDTLVVGAGNSGVQIVEELIGQGRRVFFSFRGELSTLPNNEFVQRLIFGSGLTGLSKHSWIGSMIHKRGEPVMGTNLNRLLKNQNLVRLPGMTGADDIMMMFENERVDSIVNIIWATGFVPDFSWIKLDVLDTKGMPEQERGRSKVQGLYFLGLSWMHSRASGLLGGVKEDARYVIDQFF